MKFGHFDDSRREYVIETPETPYPWINYLGNEKFFSLISNTAGGYSFYTDARLRRLTRYRYNDVPLDNNGRYFYINDGGTVWNPGWKPMRVNLDSYECRHGFGYSKILSTKNALRAEVLYLVPNGDNVEIQMLRLRNESDETKTIALHSFVEWCLYNAHDDNTNFQRNFSIGEVEVLDSTIYHKTEYRERRNHYAFYHVNAPIDGFETDRETFLGLHNNYDKPNAVFASESSNFVADGWSPVASHRINLELNPGEEKTYVFLLGYIENEEEQKWASKTNEKLLQTNAQMRQINKDKAIALQKKYDSVEKVQKAFDELEVFWSQIIDTFTLNTDDVKLNRMAVWNQYQCVVTYNFARSASYFESGIGRGIGFRDTSQDMLGVVHSLSQSRVRERLFDVASTQFEDGSAYHQFQPLTKRGNADIGGNFNDDPLWLILGVGAYIKETGDTAFLKEMVPFDNDENNKASLFEHLRRSFHHPLNNSGPHGLPLIGRADWNDCLNLNCFSTDPNDSFQTSTNKDGTNAESVMIAQMFVYVAPDYAAMCRLMGNEEEAVFAEEAAKKMADRICDVGWDGEWFVRAYDDFGNKVGSKECEDGKIFIETQGFGSMAQIGADKGYPIKALDSVAKHLDTDYGIVILDPPYKDYHVELGEVSSYPPGYKENAGIFCHNNPWIMIGEVQSGRSDKAWAYYKKIAPAYLEDISEVHRLEPYVYAQMIAGKAARRHGEAKNSWLTGTAAWNFVALSQWICGIRPDYDGLIIEPRLPAHIKKAEITREYRGCIYKISIENKNPKGTIELGSTDSVVLDGTKVLAKEGVREVAIKVCVG